MQTNEFVFNGLTGVVSADGVVAYNNHRFEISQIAGALRRAAERALEQLQEVAA